MPRVMGILNVTPDSFHDGKKYMNPESALRQAKKMLDDGADIIDVGGYSSRPGAADISEEEEASRVMPVIKLILEQYPETILSIDTFRASIAQQAVDSGASMINDISGGGLDVKMFETVAALKVPYVVMHMRGTPQTMSGLTEYKNIIQDITHYFQHKIFALRDLGVKDIILDPGFGFAKSVDHNFELLQGLHHFRMLGVPILAGLSRKSMIWRTLGGNAQEALTGTIALNTLALTQGASILRVHDVREAVECIKLLSHLPAPSHHY